MSDEKINCVRKSKSRDETFEIYFYLNLRPVRLLNIINLMQNLILNNS